MFGVKGFGPVTVDVPRIGVDGGTPPIPPLSTELFQGIFETKVNVAGICLTIEEIWSSVKKIDPGVSLTVKGSYAYSLLPIELLSTLLGRSPDSITIEPPRDLDLFFYLSVPSEPLLNEAVDSVVALIEERSGKKETDIPRNYHSKKSWDKISALFLPGVDLTFIVHQRRPRGIVTQGSLEIDLHTGEFKEGAWEALNDWIFKRIRPCHPGVYDPYDLSKITSLLLRGYSPVSWQFIEESRICMKDIGSLFRHLSEKHLREEEDRSVALMQLLAVTESAAAFRLFPEGRFSCLFSSDLDEESIQGFIQLSNWWEGLVQLPKKNSRRIEALFRSGRLTSDLLEVLFKKEQPSVVNIRSETLKGAIRDCSLPTLVKAYLLKKMCGEPYETKSVVEEIKRMTYSPLEIRILEWMGIDLHLSERMRTVVFCLQHSYSELKELAPFSQKEIQFIGNNNLLYLLRLIREEGAHEYLPSIMKRALRCADAAYELAEIVKRRPYTLNEREEELLANNPHFFILAPHFLYEKGTVACERMMRDEHFETLPEGLLWNIWQAAGKDANGESFIPLRRAVVKRCGNAPLAERLKLARSLPSGEPIQDILITSIKAGALSYGDLTEEELLLFVPATEQQLRARRAKRMVEKKQFQEAAYEMSRLNAPVHTHLVSAWEAALFYAPPPATLQWVEKLPSSQALIRYRFLHAPESRARLYTKVEPTIDLADAIATAAIGHKSPPREWLLNAGEALLPLIDEGRALSLLRLAPQELPLSTKTANRLLEWIIREGSRKDLPLSLLGGDPKLVAQARTKLFSMHLHLEMLVSLLNSLEWALVEKEVAKSLHRLPKSDLKKIEESLDCRMKVARATLTYAEIVSETLFLFTAAALPHMPRELLRLLKVGGNPTEELALQVVSVAISIEGPLTSHELQLLIEHAKRVSSPPHAFMIKQLLLQSGPQFFAFSELILHADKADEEDVPQLLRRILETEAAPPVEIHALLKESRLSFTREEFLILANRLLKLEEKLYYCRALLHLVRHSLRFSDDEVKKIREALFMRALSIVNREYLIKIEKIESEVCKTQSSLESREKVFYISAPPLDKELDELFDETFLKMIECASVKIDLDPYASNFNLTLFSPRVIQKLFLKLTALKSCYLNNTAVAYLETTETCWEKYDRRDAEFHTTFQNYLENANAASHAEIAKALSHRAFHMAVKRSSFEIPAFIRGALFSLLESADIRSNQKILFLLQNCDENVLPKKIGPQATTLFSGSWVLLHTRKSIEIWQLAQEGIAATTTLLKTLSDNFMVDSASVDRAGQLMPKVVSLLNKMSNASAGYVLTLEISEITEFLSPYIHKKTPIQRPLRIKRILQTLKTFFTNIPPPPENVEVGAKAAVESLDGSLNLRDYPLLQNQFIYGLVEIAVFGEITAPLHALINKSFIDESTVGPLSIEWISDILEALVYTSRQNISFRTSPRFLRLFLEISDTYISLLSKEETYREFCLLSARQFSSSLIAYIASPSEFEPRQAALTKEMARLTRGTPDEEESDFLAYLTFTHLSPSQPISERIFLSAVDAFFAIRSPHSIARGLLLIGLNQNTLQERFSESYPALLVAIKQKVNGSFISSEGVSLAMVKETAESVAPYLSSEREWLTFLEGLVRVVEVETEGKVNSFIPQILLLLFEKLKLKQELLDPLRERMSDYPLASL